MTTTGTRQDVATPLAILDATAFFRDLGRHQREQVAHLSRVIDCDEGDVLYRLGEPARLAYVLARGSVRLTIGIGDRIANTGDVLRRGEVFGWAAMTPSCSLRIATASCLAPCRLLAIDGPGLVALMEDDHTVGYRLTSQLNRVITGTLTSFAGG